MADNLLGREQSPYLLQHAQNPVAWYPWGSEAFAKALDTDKPILLSIGYSTCHWCHVMAHESFENEEIAALINEYFIPVKVDREERPDLDHVYMGAVTAMTGQGGWPLTVFLTPDGKPFFGGTYFPPHAKWGAPGFKDILLSIHEAWKNKRGDLVASSIEITAVLAAQTNARRQEGSSQSPEFSPTVLKAAFQQMSSQFDEYQGGFGSSPKFPMPHSLCFLLRYYSRIKEPRALMMVERSLIAMARGGIRDHVGGGFHRYSTDAKWHVPHFEKMLYDQALLARAYLEVFQVTGNKEYADIAEEIFTYVLREMRHPNGGFYCAEDADSQLPNGHEQKEGAFYVWTYQEIMEVLGQAQARTFCAWYGIEPHGNVSSDPHGEFTNKNILFVANNPEDQALAARCRALLFERQRLRPRPHLDDKILVDWNGLMISTLAFGGRVLDKPQYIEAARAGANFILSHLLKENRLLHRWRNGEAGIEATLEDYAFFINALVDVYEATFDQKYLTQAKALATVMREIFEDDQNGAFFMTSRHAEHLIVRPKEIYDGAIPSGNSAAALALLRLYGLTDEENFYISASRILAFFAADFLQAPSAHTLALCAYDFYCHGGIQVVLTGPDVESIAQMTKMVYKHFVPNKSVAYEVKESPKAMARVCKDRMCLPSTDDLGTLEQQLTD